MAWCFFFLFYYPFKIRTVELRKLEIYIVRIVSLSVYFLHVAVFRMLSGSIQGMDKHVRIAHFDGNS